MVRPLLLTALLFTATLSSCSGQTPNDSKMAQETSETNPLLCDPEEGFCKIPTSGTHEHGAEKVSTNKPIKIIYFTDPICSSCWGIEPQLRRLKLEYGKDIEIEYRMGGLLPDWSYNSGGISKPSDVAHHWDEVSLHYKMPIDGDVWLEDPLDSSYPPSIAFKAAQLQDEAKALVFLRIMREMVFLQKKNIAKWEVIAVAAEKAGLDVQQLKQDYDNEAYTLFQKDLALARQMGVRGFPTLFVSDDKGKTEILYGTRPYSDFEKALQRVHPNLIKAAYPSDWESLFHKFSTLTTREFAELSDLSFEQAEALLAKLSSEGKLAQHSTKNGMLWLRK